MKRPLMMNSGMNLQEESHVCEKHHLEDFQEYYKKMMQLEKDKEKTIK